jgi:hypothetical protein
VQRAGLANGLERQNPLANNYLWPDVQRPTPGPIPDIQWQIKLTNLHNISLASLQRSIVEYAVPPNYALKPALNISRYYFPPHDTHAVALGRQVKMRNASHPSFSVLGIFLTIALAGLVVGANLCLKACLGGAPA